MDRETDKNVIRANRLLHQRDAVHYDQRHYYTSDPGLAACIKADVQGIRRKLPAENPVFLDLGAGTGYLTKFFGEEGFRVIAIDVSENMLSVLRNRRGTNSVHCIACDIDGFLEMVKGRQFDVVGVSSTLHHLPDYVSTIDNSCRLLSSGGYFYIINEPPMKSGPA